MGLRKDFQGRHAKHKKQQPRPWWREDVMPLEPGSSRRVVGRNIGEMIRAGHPRRQAIAASLANARKSKRGGKRSGKRY
jgi:hypothetical protein